MFDLDLLRSFVSVVDAGGFTRAGERVHRTQSTVSQQIQRLEKRVGRPLLKRNGKGVSLTEEGERLLSYARRILSLAEEAKDAIARPGGDGAVRLGIPEDFAAYRLPGLLSNFARERPSLRLDVQCDQSVKLRDALDRGELDVALAKREPGQSGGVAAWPERLSWVASARHPPGMKGGPVPLAVFQQGCLYRKQAIHELEKQGRDWRIAYCSPNLTGVQAAVSAGLGISILPEIAILPDHRLLDEASGFPSLRNTELALLVAPHARPVTLRLAALLKEFCDAASANGNMSGAPDPGVEENGQAP